MQFSFGSRVQVETERDKIKETRYRETRYRERQIHRKRERNKYKGREKETDGTKRVKSKGRRESKRKEQ